MLRELFINVHIATMRLKHALIAICGTEPVDITYVLGGRYECRRIAGFVARLWTFKRIVLRVVTHVVVFCVM